MDRSGDPASLRPVRGIRALPHTESQNFTNRPCVLDKCELPVEFRLFWGLKLRPWALYTGVLSLSYIPRLVALSCLVPAEVGR